MAFCSNIYVSIIYESNIWHFRYTVHKSYKKLYTLIQLRYSHTISTLILQQLLLLFLNIFCVFRIPWRSQAHRGEKSMAINTDLVQDPIEPANELCTNGCWTNCYMENGFFHHSQMRRMYICMDYFPTWIKGEKWPSGSLPSESHTMHGVVTIIYHKNINQM